MHADRKNRPVDPARPGVDAAEADAAEEAAAEEAEAEAVPMNRAERRAKGKHVTPPQAVGKIVPGRVNNGHGPRSYANRRSGGGR